MNLWASIIMCKMEKNQGHQFFNRTSRSTKRKDTFLFNTRMPIFFGKALHIFRVWLFCHFVKVEVERFKAQVSARRLTSKKLSTRRQSTGCHPTLCEVIWIDRIHHVFISYTIYIRKLELRGVNSFSAPFQVTWQLEEPIRKLTFC